VNENLQPLLDALRSADAERAEAMLRDDPSLLQAQDSYGTTPLHVVVGEERPAAERERCLRLLLSLGADASAVNHNGHTPLRSAVWFGDEVAAATFREHQASLYGTRPVWRPPPEIVGRVQRLLSQAWNGPVTLGDCYQLRGDRVLRFDVVAAPDVEGAPTPASVVVKQARRDEEHPYDPDSTDLRHGPWGFFADWAGTQFFASLPGSGEYGSRFYAGDREAGLLVLEDLGDGEALVDRLMGDDPRRAEEGLRMLAECVGRMHAETIGRQERYQEYRDALGPRGRHSSIWHRLEESRERLLKGFEAIGVTPAAGFDEEYARLAAAMDDPGPFLAYVHGDPCPDNCRIVEGRLRLFDFETSGFKHAMLDAVYGRIAFPSCWCVNRLPPHVAPMMEAAYRAALLPGCPAAADDARFHQELVHCCAAWLIINGTWMLDEVHRDDFRWGISTWRQRVLVRLDALADATEEFDHLPAMGATARLCTRRLRQIWPEDADAMPLYPAYRLA
jgi:hypothetical protein